MRVSRQTIVLVLAAVVALLAAVAMHGNVASGWHSRLRAAIHGDR